MKKAETQEQEFLEVCSSYDYDLLTGKREMTLKDYERITYLVSSLGYSQYLQLDRKSTRLNSSHLARSRMPSSA